MHDSDQLHVTGSVHGDVLVITILAEEICDQKTSHALRDEISLLMDSNESSHVVLDLHRVLVMGSVGCLVFLALRRRVEPGRIVICNMTPAVYDLFNVCRLISTDDSSTVAAFEADDTLQAALTRLSR
jgi:anti-anti-sigma factor